MDTNTILLVSATKLEIKPLISETNKITDNLFASTINGLPIEILITGVGIHAMMYSLTKLLSSKKYKFIILAGISGSFSTEITLGTVVNVMSDRFSDFGANSINGFISVFDMGLANANEWPYSNGILENYTLINNKVVENILTVKGSTVQSIKTNTQNNIAQNIEVESMEGAAFFYCCMMEKQAFIQIRSISNYVGEQDKNKWDIPLAVSNLNNTLKDILQEITK
ncbi:MAG: hypothetical protein KAG84_06535 [Bacteroidales bacterium]|nr:hypothetical protein [Bacteroidales bacterium]